MRWYMFGLMVMVCGLAAWNIVLMIEIDAARRAIRRLNGGVVWRRDSGYWNGPEEGK